MGIKLEDLIKENKAPILEDKSKKIMNVLIVSITIIVIMIVILVIIIMIDNQKKQLKERAQNIISDTNLIKAVITNLYNQSLETGDESLLIGIRQDDRTKAYDPITLNVGGQNIEYKYGYYYVTGQELSALDEQLSLLHYPEEDYVINYARGEAVNLNGVNPSTLLSKYSYKSKKYYDNEDLLAIVNGQVPPSDYTIYINSTEDLEAIKDHPDYRYKLCTNIDMSSYHKGEGWEPIDRFTGYFDGRGYEISNLYIKRPEQKYCGLFGHIEEGGIVNNLVLKSVDISGGEYTGGIAGSCNGILSNCSVEGIVSSQSDRVGGAFGEFAGEATHIYVTDMEVNGDNKAGGFVGSLEGGKLEKCIFEGKVGGNTNIGGFAGIISTTKELTVSETYSKARISAEEKSAGGYVGKIEVNNSRNLKILDSYANGDIEHCNVNAGGFVGDLYTKADTNIELTRLYTTVDTPSDCLSTGGRGGFAGKAYIGSSINLSYCYWELDKVTDRYKDTEEIITDIGINEDSQNTIKFESRSHSQLIANNFNEFSTNAVIWNTKIANDLPRFVWEVINK